MSYDVEITSTIHHGRCDLTAIKAIWLVNCDHSPRPAATSPVVICCELESAMIKDVMVRLDGTLADDRRLATVASIAQLFDSHVIGLFFNILPLPLPPEGNGASARISAQLAESAREVGAATEEALARRLAHLNRPVEIRRFDVFADAVADIVSSQARTADTFVNLRLDPNRSSRDEARLVEGVLFGSGRHLFVAGDKPLFEEGFDHVVVAWNGSRESARGLREALPYMSKTGAVTVLVIDSDRPTEGDALLGTDVVSHLKHHGIEATLHHAQSEDGDVASTLIAEARRLNAGLIAMGGYGHSRFREWLLGGVTYQLLRHAPVPAVIAH
jgi:nucleotide-binding universal stress UspA family protein